MPGILFLHGGDAIARDVYCMEGCGYWAQAFPLCLEKHGQLGFDEASVEDLDLTTLSQYDCVLQ